MVDSSYVLRALAEKDMAQMHRTFSESFADYAVPYNLTLDEFKRKMEYKVHINFPYSIGAFSNEKLVAFIFHSINQYEGSLMAYNAGTGVLPGHRGSHISVALYDQVLPILSQGGVECSVLEVLQKNSKAIRVYEEVGFKKTKEFLCFQSKGGIESGETRCDIRVVIGELSRYEGFGINHTSFGDTNHQLQYNIQNETTLEATFEGELTGFLIFQHALGRITQFGVRDEFKRRGIGRALFSKAQLISKKPLTVINVNSDYSDLHRFLGSLGFKNTMNQFEMQLQIG